MFNIASGGRQEKKVKVIVNTQPKDIEITLNGEIVDTVVEISAFQDLFLSCNASANISAPVIKWLKNGNKIGDDKVFLSNAKMNDHDGNYKCTVVNDVRVSSKTIKIKLKIAPFTNSKQDQFFVVKNNETVSLNCDIIGWPDPQIRW